MNFPKKASLSHSDKHFEPCYTSNMKWLKAVDYCHEKTHPTHVWQVSDIAALTKLHSFTKPPSKI